MIISQTIIRNEKNRFLKRWLAGNMPYFDKMVIYDDASDEGTAQAIEELQSPKIILIKGTEPIFKKNENQVRTSLWEEVRKVAKEGDWILTLDSDEIVCEEFAEFTKFIPPQAQLISFKKIEMWDEENYRVDGLWSNYFDRMFPYRNEPFGFIGEGFHYPSVPSYAFHSRTKTPVMQSDVRILHLGYINEEERNKKYDFMMGNKQQEKDVTYYHLLSIKERPPILKKYTRERPMPTIMFLFVGSRQYKINERMLEEIKNIDYDKSKIDLWFLLSDCGMEAYKQIESFEDGKFHNVKFTISQYSEDNEACAKREAINSIKGMKDCPDFVFILDNDRPFMKDWLYHFVLMDGFAAIPYQDRVDCILLSKEVLPCLIPERLGYKEHINTDIISNIMKAGYLVWGGVYITPFPINPLSYEQIARML